MNRILLGCLIALTSCCIGCGSWRTVTLEEGLRNTQAGKYTLVAVTDDFISFQVDGFHKYQFYSDRSSIAAAVPRLEKAVEAAIKTGHGVAIIDARNQKPDETSQPR